MNKKTLQERAISEQWLARIQKKDASLWSDDPQTQSKISQRLGWLDSIHWLDDKISTIVEVRDALLQDGIDHVVLLGMGGSSLAPEVCRVMNESISNHHQDGHADDESKLLSFQMLDDTAPSAVREVLNNIALKKTVFLVASKSGSTLETDSFFRYFYQQYDKAEAGKHFIAITDNGTQMAKTAENLNFRHSFINPSDIGGRFSALSFFGIVPAIFMGIPVESMLAGAKQEYNDTFLSQDEMPSTLTFALQIGGWALSGKNKCFLSYSQDLKVMEMWIDQLIAESTGKLSKGILPVSTLDSFDLTDDGFWVKVNYGPNDSVKTIHIDDASTTLSWSIANWVDIGRDFLRWELITAVLGIILKINPFDEPDVTVAKEKTKEILSNPSVAKKLNVFKVSSVSGLTEALEKNLKTTASPYISVAIYGDDKRESLELLTTLQDDYHQKYRVPVVVNVGPRYLHSSGQLHKGGPAQGLFIVVTLGYGVDETIPNQPFSFATLNRAQALGDMSALNDRERPIMWIDLDKASDLKTFMG